MEIKGRELSLKEYTHIQSEGKRFNIPADDTNWASRQLQAFTRNGKNPLEYVLIEETVVSEHYSWEAKFVLKWVKLPASQQLSTRNPYVV